MIQMSPDKSTISRKVYSLGDIVNEIGGFFGSLDIVFRLVVPLFQFASLEKYLVSKLYKQQDADILDLDNSPDHLFELASQSLKSRRKIKPTWKPDAILSL